MQRDGPAAGTEHDGVPVAAVLHAVPGRGADAVLARGAVAEQLTVRADQPVVVQRHHGRHAGAAQGPQDGRRLGVPGVVDVGDVRSDPLGEVLHLRACSGFHGDRTSDPIAPAAPGGFCTWYWTTSCPERRSTSASARTTASSPPGCRYGVCSCRTRTALLRVAACHRLVR